MNWWEWVFSGIGASGVISVVGLFVQRWLKSSRENTSSLTAQGAKVSGSPVASGTGITQTISETHHHYPQAAPAPVVPAPRPEPEPTPNLRFAGANNILIFEGLDHAFYQAEEDQGHTAAVVNVTNDARQNTENIGARVKATLIYHKTNGQEIRRVTGTWLGQHADFVEFRVDELHKVIVGISDSHGFAVPGKRRIQTDFRRVVHVTDVETLAVEQMIVTIRLTDADTGDFFCERQCTLQTMPLLVQMQ